MGLLVLRGDALEVGVERSSDSGEGADAMLSIFSQCNHRLLRPTSSAWNMAVLGGVQHLAVGVAERPQGSPGGAADGGGVCRVRRSRVVRRTGLHAMITLPAFPDVHLSDVVVEIGRAHV